MTAPFRVPVTIVTGALGAGKSTLMRHILTERHGLRIAVIENEFADSMGIESLILKNGVGGPIADGFYELANGCICCSVRDSLVSTLMSLMAVREKFDYVLVETSGLANPGPVATMFWIDLGDDCPFELDGIVTVVDARNFDTAFSRPREAGSVNEVEQQIAYADVILLNKTDIVHADQLPVVESSLRKLNGIAAILPVSFSVTPLPAILNLHTTRYVANGTAHAAACQSDGSTFDHSGHDHAGVACTAQDCTELLASGSHTHDSNVSHVTLRSCNHLSLQKLREFLGCLIWEHVVAAAGPGVLEVSVFRVKGLVWAYGDGFDSSGGPVATPTPYLVQGVHDIFDVEPIEGGSLLADLPTGSSLYLIGAHVAAHERALSAGLAACEVAGVSGSGDAMA